MRKRLIAVTRVMVGLILVTATITANASPITWSDTYLGDNQLLTAGESLSVQMDINSVFDRERDSLLNFNFTWDLRDNDPDIFRHGRWVQYSYSCGWRRTCTGSYYSVTTNPGQTESAQLTGPGHESFEFQVGNTCSGNACSGSELVTSYSFADTPEGMDMLQTTGLFHVTLTAITGDFYVEDATLTVTWEEGLPTASVPVPGTLALMLMGILGLIASYSRPAIQTYPLVRDRRQG